MNEQIDRLKSLGVLRPARIGSPGKFGAGASNLVTSSLRPEERTFLTPLGTELTLQPIQVPELSSTEIRREIAVRGFPLDRNHLRESVDSYLKAHELYGRVP